MCFHRRILVSPVTLWVMQRDYVLLFVNGQEKRVAGEEAFLTLANWLRNSQGLTGTKIVCAEGDCGSCTILVGRPTKAGIDYQAVNSCITYPYLHDLCHIVTIEGIGTRERPHAIQAAMQKFHGAQCGYCTPGFICAAMAMAQKLKAKGRPVTEKVAKNYLTGNLCRCTGYEGILQAYTSLDLSAISSLDEVYPPEKMLAKFSQHATDQVVVKAKDKVCHIPSSLKELKTLLGQSKQVVVSSGATDLGVQYNKGRLFAKEILCLNNIASLYEISQEGSEIHIGAKVTLSQVEREVESSFPELARLLKVFASPQIKNKGTLVGNIANGSPIGDCLPLLIVAEAKVCLESSTDKRELSLESYYLGYKKFALMPGEIVTKIILPKSSDLFKMYKVSNRKDLDISTVNFAARIQLENSIVKKAKIALGGVGPTVVRVRQFEQLLIGRPWSWQELSGFADHLETEIHPISDLRGSSEYRKKLAKNLFLKLLHEECPMGEK